MRERGVLGRCRRHLRWLKRPAWPLGCVGGVQGRGGRGMSATVVLCTRMWPLNTPPPGLREPPGGRPPTTPRAPPCPAQLPGGGLGTCWTGIRAAGRPTGRLGRGAALRRRALRLDVVGSR